ncbi:MAG: hypothetical protein WBB86_01740 [Candidatus Omnitrophota bacterium]
MNILQKKYAHGFAMPARLIKGVLPAAVMALICLVGRFCPAAQYDDEKAFFSYERFYDKSVVMEEPPRDGKLQKDISSFLNEFSMGIYAISEGDMEQAEEHLKEARAIWPEYFGTDFLLARINEDTGNVRLAARYYKSYLNKLRSFWQRENRISEKLIMSLTPYGVEDYEAAQEVIRRRLKGYGIDLDSVRPVYTVPPLVKTIVLFSGAASIYILIVYVVLPYVRKRRRIASAPKGYWICPKCETENTTLQKECGICRFPQP